MFQHLSDLDLHVEIEKAAARERQATLDFLEYLYEVDYRRVYSARGYASLWEYVHKYLKYSESQASERVNAMRLMCRVPEVKNCIRENKLNLTVAARLAAHAKRENLSTNKTTLLLKTIAHKSVKEVERVFASTQTKPILRPDVIKPTGKSTSRISFDVDEEFLALLNEVKKYESNPGIKMEGLLKKVMKEFVSKRKAAKNTPVLRMKKVSNKRYIPRAIQSAIRKRSKNQCEFVDPKTSRRCECKTSLQFDHIHPLYLGGETKLENLRVLCRSHNLYEAIRVLGEDKIGPHLKKH